MPLILPHLELWQEDFLGLLGWAQTPRLTPEAGKLYRLPRVEYSDFLHGTTSFAAICLSTLDTAKRIPQAVPSASSDERILYINDPDPYYGSISNQDAVLDLLRQRGVTIVEPGRLPTPQRINLFRNADVVIGPLGQGLTDLVFCRPGALVREWMPRHHQRPGSSET